ncbi:MAG: hypothetical protein M1836_008000 [Candelina mexicana]|nr:MAG: hypothetical protein M1836_008000 [Candelina mexicana]
MSCYLWKLYIENDVDQFRQLLEASSYISKPQGQRGNAISGGNSSVTKAGGSKVALASSPQSTSKSYKGIGWISAKVNNSHSSLTLTRADVNSRDDNGNTILHYAASSTLKSEIPLALALVDHPLIDLYIQDLESGWTVLHRALYSGNITIARTIIERNVRDTLGISTGVASHNVEGIIKVKDREGNSPFDLFAATTTARLLVNTNITRGNTDETEEESDSADGQSSGNDSYDGTMSGQVNIQGDEVFAFGSNKNLSLGFGDEDDRQYPERISLKRPAHLLQRFYREDRGKPQQISISHLDNDTSLASDEALPKLPSSLPAIIQNRPLIIQDVALSKLHSAIVTTDPESNLYICGFGPGGRLGTGDETTRFSYVCIESGGLAGKKVISVALGQNHTLAVSHEGEVFTWGVNTFGQLGYALPAPALKDQEPIQLTPRQIFGSLRKETVTGIAASRIHSVVFTQSSLFTFGKNEGQLGLVDSDARSLEIQVAPRKVAASLFTAPIHMVTAIERATICLLESHEIWVFANYGYTKVVFPIEAFIDYALPSTAPAQYRREMLRNMRRQTTPNHICKIASGGDTICAMSRMGDVFSMTVTQQLEPGPTASSTTNPTKIRNGLSPLQRVWSPKKGHMAVRDVGVGQDGSIIICTESGSVWRRVKRVKIKDANAYSGHTKPKDYKFQRVPGLTRIAAVRSNPFGAYAAIRKDSDVTRSQVRVDKQTIWNDFAPLISIDGFRIPEEDSDAENPRMRFWAPATSTAGSHPLKTALRNSTDVEADLHEYISSNVNDTNSPYDVEIRTTLSDVSIPSHRVMLSSRSRVLRHALTETSRAGSFVIPDLLSMQKDEAGKIQVVFHGLDFLSILNVVLYVYLDIVLDVWHYIHHAPKSAFRYRQARTELMRVAGRLELRLEPAVRTMVDPTKSLAADMERAISDPIFFDDADVIVELAGQEARVHSVLMCQRCPFFEGLFKGRAAGRWLSNRRDLAEDPTDVVRVDLKHVEPATFSLILRHLYADTGEELFRDIVTSNLDEFLDLIIEVMSIANELMLDRLSQICQKVLGGYDIVNLRNACQLLNAVAPCSVTEFKDATLEYLCMNLEAMLEGHLLDELDEDLLLELDQVVRDNQLAFLPIAKSGRAEDLLHEKYPELAATIERGRQAKIQSLAAEIRQREENVWRRPSKDASLIPQSPNLKSKTSAADLMFDMDDDEAMLGKRNNLRTSQQESLPRGYESRTQSITNLTGPSPHSIDVNAQHDVNGKVTVPSEDGSIGSPSPMLGPPLVSSSSKPTTNPGDLPSKSGSMRSTPWDTGTVPLTKLDLKEIMAQTSSSRPSNIALGLSLESKRDEVGSKSFASRTSQKERKKHQFQQQQKQPMVETPIPSTPENIAPVEKPKSPWQTASPSPKVSLKDVLDPQQKGSSPSPRSTSNTRLNLRQTVANNGAATRKLSTPSASSATAQHRSVSTPNVPKPNTGQSSPSTPPQPAAPSSTRPSTTTRTVSTPTASLPIQSIRYQPPANAEPSLQLSMADILTQQQLEKDVIRDAVAKRSLQEIQQEQEFQEWWDLESRKVREEEEEMAKEKTRGDKDERGGRGKRSGRGDVRGSRGRGRGRGRGTGADRGRFSERSVI